MPHLRKVRKSNKIFNSAILRFAKLNCGAPIFADLVAVRYRRFLGMVNLHTYIVVRGVQVELTPPSPGELGAVVRGAGGLVKDALTFRWAQVQIFLYNLA